MRVLKSGVEVKLADIVRKLGASEQEAEQALIAALTANPGLGSFNAFSGTFTRGENISPALPIPSVKKKNPQIRVIERSRRPRAARIAGILSLIIFGSLTLIVISLPSAGTSDGQFQDVLGIAVNETGCVYVADYTNNRVQVFTSDGQFLRKWGNRGVAEGQFIGPAGVAINSTGYVYVLEDQNARVQVFTPTGDFLFQWECTSRPDGFAINSTGFVYVREGTEMKVYTATGQLVSTWSQMSSLHSPLGLAINGTGYVYLGRSNATTMCVQVYTAGGDFVTQWGEAGSEVGQFSWVRSIAIDDSTGNVFIADGNPNNRVQVYTPTGHFITSWGSWGIFLGQFNHLSCIAINSGTGRVYAGEFQYDSDVQIFTLGGQSLFQWGGSPRKTILPSLIVGTTCSALVAGIGYISLLKTKKAESRRMKEEDAKRRADEKKAVASLDAEFEKWTKDGRKV